MGRRPQGQGRAQSWTARPTTVCLAEWCCRCWTPTRADERSAWKRPSFLISCASWSMARSPRRLVGSALIRRWQPWRRQLVRRDKRPPRFSLLRSLTTCTPATRQSHMAAAAFSRRWRNSWWRTAPIIEQGIGAARSRSITRRTPIARRRKTQADVIEFLLSIGADPDALDKSGVALAASGSPDAGGVGRPRLAGWRRQTAATE